MAAAILFLLFITMPITIANENYKRDTVLDRLSTGMKFAHDFLGSESVALKVADFVVKAFNTVNNPKLVKNQQEPTRDINQGNTFDSAENSDEKNLPNSNLHQTLNPMSPWRHLIRLLGLQPNQISAVAVNALVFVAQIISTFLTGNRSPGKPVRSEDPSTWILNKNSRRLQFIINSAKNGSLPILIDRLLTEQYPDEETSCIRLLVCKITPFITKMQNTVFGVDDMKQRSSKTIGSEILYRHLPTSDEINNRNYFCEKQHKECDLRE